MGIALFSMAGQALRRLGTRRARLPVVIMLIAIVLGGSLALWARLNLNRLLEIHPSVVLAATIEAHEGFCGTPALYIQPEPTGSGRSDYRVLVDMIGGPNRFPDLSGETAVSVLSLPESRRPGVGLGRGLPDRCEIVRLRIDGDFTGVTDIADAGATKVIPDGPGAVTVEYRLPEAAHEDAAIARFVLRDVPDVWQFGHKRVQFINGSAQGVNIFLYEEPGYLFLNENFAFVRPPNVRRGFVDIHLEMMGGQFASSADVVRRRPTSDLELQQSLINLSTVFGIGISLLVEGILILLVSVATSMRPRTPERRGDE